MAWRWTGDEYASKFVNYNLKNKFQWNLKQDSHIFIQENTYENVVWKMAAILSLPQCVNITMLHSTHPGHMKAATSCGELSSLADGKSHL